MTARLRINSKQSLSAAIGELSKAFSEHKYLVVSYRIGRDRTLDQNALWWSMYERIAQMTNMGDVEDARKYCKLHIGVGIMRRDDAVFRDGWDMMIKPLPYEQQMELMGSCALMGADGFPVTRLFNRKQGIEYTSSIVAEFTKNNVYFDDLLDEVK